MIRLFSFLLTCLFLFATANSQTVKQPAKDSAAYRANDRLKNAGPKDGWKKKQNPKTAIKAQKDPADTIRRTDSLKKKN